MSLTVWYVNHYASLPSQGRGDRPHNLARQLKKHGHQCIVIAAGCHHLQQPGIEPPPLNKMIREGAVEYYFLPTTSYSGNQIGRLYNMISFGRRIAELPAAIGKGLLPAPDVIIASSPTPWAYDGARRMRRSMPGKLIYEERDLWPLSLVEIAGVHPWNPVVFWMHRIVRHACSHADAVVSLLPFALDALSPLGLTEGRFYWIPNGILAEDWSDADDRGTLPDPHRLALDACRSRGELIVVYAGAHGPANDLGQLLALSRGSKDRKPYHILCVGDGPSKAGLQQWAQQERLSFISFLPQLQKSALRCFLRQADAAFIGLKDCPLFQFGVSPNKVFDYMMAGLPTVWAIRAGNNIVEEANAGIAVVPGDSESLDKAFRALCLMNHEERRCLGENGRSYVLRYHSWETLGQRYAKLCEQLFACRSHVSSQ